MPAAEFISESVLQKLQSVYERVQKNNPIPTDLSPIGVAFNSLSINAEVGPDLKPGEILLKENDIGHAMYWVESGVLAILQGDLDNPRLLAFRYAGEIIGEMALLEELPRMATAVAIQPARLKSLSQETFQALLPRLPEFSIELMRLLSSRLREIQAPEQNTIDTGLHDPLTGALTRQTFDARLGEEIERARLYEHSLALVFIDLDWFKEINDHFGHIRGDEFLVAFVQRMLSSIRVNDLLFRYGGDEFILILPGMNNANAIILIQRIFDNFRSEPVLHDPPLKLSFSAGIAYFPNDTDDIETLVDTADQRVYQAKKNGRGQVVGAPQESHSALQ